MKRNHPRRCFSLMLAIMLAGVPLAAAAQDASPDEAATPVPVPTATPMPTATPVPTDTPAPTDTAEPTASAVPTATAVPAKAYLICEGVLRAGEPNDLVAWCIENGMQNVTIYLTEEGPFTIRDATYMQLAQFTFAPDRSVFPDTAKVAMLSATSPEGAQEAGTYYLWVGTAQEMPTSAPEPTATAAPDAEPTAPADGTGARPEGGAPDTAGRMPAGSMHGGAAVVTRTIPHAPSTQESVVAYDGVELTLTGEEMSVLELGGEALEVALVAAETAGTFTAQLLCWNGESEETPNTLLLTAGTTAEREDARYAWTFSGRAMRKLHNSGIAYLVLESDGQVTALSTAGCLAGPIYTRWRTQGIPTKEWIYQVTMQATGGEASDAAMEMSVSVRGDTYTLTDDPQESIYCYDVCTGTIQLLEAPFGAQAAQE